MSFYDWFFEEAGRTPEGLFSFAHIASVTISLGITIALAVILGRLFKNDSKKQNITLIVVAALNLLLFIGKMTYFLINTTDTWWGVIIGNAPCYLCDMQIFILPLAALTRGRFRNWCLDFVAIWGLLMGFFGTYFAGNIYGAHCVISYSAFTGLFAHVFPAFASMFIWMCKLNTMEKKNIPFVVGILVIYMTVALILDYADEHNFMFFKDGNGTPFELFRQLVGYNLVLYAIEIYILQCGYMVGCYYGYYGILKLIANHKAKKENEQNQEVVESESINEIKEEVEGE